MVTLVTLVPVVPFRWFRSVVPGFTTCHFFPGLESRGISIRIKESRGKLVIELDWIYVNNVNNKENLLLAHKCTTLVKIACCTSELDT